MKQTRSLTLNTAKKAKIDVGKTWDQIAAEAGCATTYLWKILHSQEPGKTKRPLIAKALGLTVEDLWPSEERESA